MQHLSLNCLICSNVTCITRPGSTKELPEETASLLREKTSDEAISFRSLRSRARLQGRKAGRQGPASRLDLLLENMAKNTMSAVTFRGALVRVSEKATAGERNEPTTRSPSRERDAWRWSNSSRADPCVNFQSKSPAQKDLCDQ